MTKPAKIAITLAGAVIGLWTGDRVAAHGGGAGLQLVAAMFAGFVLGFVLGMITQRFKL